MALMRCLDMGDSISSLVYSDEGEADQRRLASYQLQGITGQPIYNISAPGQRITEGGQPGFGLFANRNAIKTVAGYAGAQLATFILGTNDHDNPGTNIYTYMDNLRELIRSTRIDLNMPIVVITPYLRSDEGVAKPHSDGKSWTLAEWRYFTAAVAYEEAAKPGHFISVFHGEECPLLPHHRVRDGVHPTEEGQDIIRDWRLAKMRSVGYWL